MKLDIKDLLGSCTDLGRPNSAVLILIPCIADINVTYSSPIYSTIRHLPDTNSIFLPEHAYH